MIKINGYFKTAFIVEIDVDSFDDICEEKMPIKTSDKMVLEAIEKKYGITPNDIWVGREVTE
jgi:hypothetical protein